jgi:hypothetical protein
VVIAKTCELSVGFLERASASPFSTPFLYTTTRKRLIAALLTAGEYVLKMPAVRPSRVA